MGTALGVPCPARDPHPVLLEQLTRLAAASVAPTVKPWWHRFTAKTGAAAVAGLLMISGATADAQHSGPKPAAPAPAIAVAPLPVPPHVTHRHTSPSMPATLPESASPAHGAEAPGRGRRHRGSARRHHGRSTLHGPGVKADLPRELEETSAPLVLGSSPQASLVASSNLLSTPHAHGRARQRSKSHR